MIEVSLTKNKVAYIDELDKVYPGPSNITERMPRRTRTNKLNGDEAKRRLELMRIYHIPYQHDGAYGNKGEIPRLEPLTAMEQVERQRIRFDVV